MRKDNDRRSKARQKINMEIQYRTLEITTFETGLLYDLSLTGALFTAKRDLAVDEIIQLVIPGDNPQTPGAHIIARIVRKKYHQFRQRKFEYGCRFDYRRSGDRQTHNTAIKYRTSQMAVFEDALLWNLNRWGALFSTDRDIEINTSVHLAITPDDPRKAAIQVIATVVRKEFYKMRRRKFGYGCKFSQAIDWD
jgi:hypothetical protein